jgi:hypothetical protein
MKPITQKFQMFSKDDASYLPAVTHFYEHKTKTAPGIFRAFTAGYRGLRT